MCFIRWSMTDTWEGVDRGYGFVSGLLEDWWRARHGQYFTPMIGW